MDARPRTKAEVEALFFVGKSASTVVFDGPHPLVDHKPSKPWRPGQPAAGDPA